MNQKHQAIEVIGWYGVAAIVGAYALLTFGVIAAGSLAYQLLNLTGSVAIVIEASMKKDWQPVALNVVWMIIAVIGLASAFFAR